MIKKSRWRYLNPGYWIMRSLTWIKYRTYRRYHVLKLKLNPGWHDTDVRMLYAAFGLLVDFVEKENALDVIDWEGSGDEHVQAADEIEELYDWWKHERPRRRRPLDDLADDLWPPYKNWETVMDARDIEYPSYQEAFAKTMKLEQQWEEEDTQNLIRLIRVRTFLYV